MRLIVIGSGSIIPTPTRFSSAIYLESRGHRLLLDCGPATINRLSLMNVTPYVIDTLLLTHYHVDHVADLLPLIKLRAYNEKGEVAKSPRPLKIYGPTGLYQLLDALIEKNAYFRYLAEVMNYRRYVQLVEVREGEEYKMGDLVFRVCYVKHYNGVAYRIESEGKSIVYSGDAALDKNLISLARSADLLIHECSFPKGELVGLHVSEEELSQIVSEVRPRMVVVTHLYPSWNGREHLIADSITSKHRCKVVIAHDGLEVVL